MLKKYLNIIHNSIFCIGVIIMFFGIIISSFSLQTNELALRAGLISAGIGAVSLGIAFCSIVISFKSDEKMRTISELSFVEKNATIYGYIDDLEGLKGGHFMAFPSSTPDNKTVSNDILKKMIRDLDSALIVINYIGEETRNKFLCAFIGFSKAIKDHVIAFKEDDIQDYLRIIGLVEKYQFEDEEKAIDNLKKILEEKLSNKVTE